MKKYEYRYCVYKNNLRDGIRYLRSYRTLGEALRDKAEIEMSGGGCCNVVKKKFLIGSSQPHIVSICNNYRYSELDLYL